ncbi:hypothetical protein EV363DRAFT_1183515 [Boletus edulis]|uniref:Uncharacterized protein n=1 Tax=Boletus edulis BED1 TaxID=1328754 RepID=A0AAD4G9C4_BOLED|nr:hypothetical protein EV363DRAFT_1183515 [Boletus edulis]KAF8431176.1 hypothetical protein L210DRAFT_986003 [Boletus edulis BED1]
MSQSSDPENHKLHHQCMDAKVAIRDVIREVICDSSRVLINTSSGRFLDKAEQTVVFESLPVFNELIMVASTVTTTIDHARIKHDSCLDTPQIPSLVVRFYNEDGTLYMNLDIPNHKD